MNRRTERAGLCESGALAVLLLAMPALVQAQQPLLQIVEPGGRLILGNEDPALQPRADIDKDLSKALRKAEEYRDKGDFDSAVEIVQRYILDQRDDRADNPAGDRSADYFTDQSMKTSLKRQALDLIGGLPPEGRRKYELKFGESARVMLADAVAANDMAELENVTRQYFHARAGFEAAYLIGTHKLDQGEPLAAAMYFSRLRELPEAARQWEPMLSLKSAVAWYRAGEAERAVETLTALKNATPAGRLILGQKTVALFANEGEAEGWLARLAGPPAGGHLTRQGEGGQAGERQWTMFRGDPSRNGGGSPASPARDSWEFATVRDSDALLLEDPQRLDDIDQQLSRMEADNRSSGFLTLPAVHPLVIDDAVIFRTLRNVRAVHLKTGELLWESINVSEWYERLVGSSTPAAERADQQAASLETMLAQRAWRDLAAGTLSSDGRYVFALEVMGYLTPDRQNRRGMLLALPQTDFNKLVAYELATDGKPAWQVGGERKYGLELAGTFFLGPPLPIDGRLYCIAEVAGDVRLVVLDAQTGKLEWSQTLALPDAPLPQYPLRRLAGSTPAYSNGVLICPTTSGAVVAIDPARRILLWGHRYSRSVPEIPTDPRLAFRMRAMGGVVTNATDDEDRWVDAAPTIADGRVLITPRDSSELRCLNLVDGSLAWKQPRGQSLYVATVHEGKVVLVGRSQVQAVSLDTGEPAWDEPIAIEMPSGRGVRDGRHYRIPLSTGEIASIDLAAGRIVARSKSRTGEVFGNLAVADGTIVSQSINKIVGFESLDELRRQTDGVLVQRPDDADALALRGEMRLHDGNEEQGLADLRKSIEIKPTSRSRGLVVATLLEGLRRDFQKYSPSADEIERLVDDPRQRGRYLRLHAAGLHEMGDQQGAFREYLKLATSDTGRPELERLNATLSVRSDRWIRPRIVEVYRKSEGAQRAELDRQIAELLDNASEAEDAPRMLRRFLDAFVDLPVGDRAGRLLAERIDPDEQPLSLELLLLRLRRSDEPEVAGFATARLASLYIGHKRSAAAATMLDELATRWNDVVCLDEKTGRQLVEEWRADEDVAGLLEEKSSWPDRKIEARQVPRQHPVQRAYPVRIVGPRAPLGDDWTLSLDARRQNLIARDENGKELWTLPTAALEGMSPNVYGNYARVNGHLLIVVFGTHFVVLDGLNQANQTPRILWQEQLVDGVKGDPRNLQAQFRQVLGPGGVRVMTAQDRQGRPLGKVVPIDDTLICYQIGTRLVAADPLTGETLWERRSLTRGSDLFGDREFVFVVAPNTKEAITLRAADGEQVAARPLPKEGTQLSSRGRHMLVWTGRMLQKFDVWTGENVWEKRVPPGAQAIVLEEGGDEVAVLNPHQGTFLLFDAEDGRLLIDSQIEPDAPLDSFLVVRSSDHYVLLTHSPPRQVNVVEVEAPYNNAFVNGFVYGFDRRSGQKIWTTRVKEQAIDVDQPAGLPVLVFTARTYRPFRGGKRLTRNMQFSVAVIDKRNGRNVYSEAGVQSLSQFEVTADPAKQEIAINFYRSALQLSLTNEPLAEPLNAKGGGVDAEGEQ